MSRQQAGVKPKISCFLSHSSRHLVVLFENFWRKIMGKKCWRKMVMKLTPELFNATKDIWKSNYGFISEDTLHFSALNYVQWGSLYIAIIDKSPNLFQKSILKMFYVYLWSILLLFLAFFSANWSFIYFYLK